MEFVLPMAPHAKQRPRARVVRGRPHIYTPQETIDWEADAHMAAIDALGGTKMTEAEVSLSAVFVCPRPQRLMRKRDPDGLIPGGRGDVSNFVKSLEDALNGVCWVDDSQVVRVEAEKFYAEKNGKPRIHVRVEEVSK